MRAILSFVVLGTLCAVGLPSPASAAMVEGQWLQINPTNGFAGSGNRDHFNYYTTINSGHNTTTGGTSMIDSLGNVVPGVTLTAAGWQGQNGYGVANVWAGLGRPTEAAAAGAGNSAWSDEEIRSFWWGNSSDPTITIHGLDGGLTYNAWVYSKHPEASNTGEVTTVTLNGVSIVGENRGNRWFSPTADFVFSGIAPVNGELHFSFDSSNPFLTGIIIQAIPEPSTYALGLMGALGVGLLLCRRRKR